MFSNNCIVLLTIVHGTTGIRLNEYRYEVNDG